MFECNIYIFEYVLNRTQDETLTFVYEEAVDRLDPSAGMYEVHQEWSYQHAKILCLVSQYGVCARSATEDESWIRQIPIYVMIYESITAGVIDFDYAPCSTVVSVGGKSRRVWFNISQVN